MLFLINLISNYVLYDNNMHENISCIGILKASVRLWWIYIYRFKKCKRLFSPKKDSTNIFQLHSPTPQNPQNLSVSPKDLSCHDQENRKLEFVIAIEIFIEWYYLVHENCLNLVQFAFNHLFKKMSTISVVVKIFIAN